MVAPLLSRLWLVTFLLAGVPSHGGCNGDLIINVGVSEPPPADDEVGVDDEDSAGSPKTEVRVAIFKQTVSGNSSTDTVTIDYVEPDGTRVTQLTDFRMHTQVTRVILLGEEELNEPAYQVLCFVSAFTGDLIPPEAVMKLRQKHPGTVRVAETDEGAVVQDSPLVVVRGQAKSLSSHLPSLCKEAAAAASTFTSSHEVHSILHQQGRETGGTEGLARPHPGYEGLERCSSLAAAAGGGRGGAAAAAACQCSRAVDFYWYPCALKYCRNQDSEGEHRCGIRTCKKTLTFRYPAKSKQHCLWDEV